jgi:hypothetical protein
MGYLDFYDILTDEHIAPGFKRAVKLAKAGPRLLREAYKVEEQIDNGFNRACWTLTGGSYMKRDANWQLQLAEGPVAPEPSQTSKPAPDEEQGENEWLSPVGKQPSSLH